jgi:hypothetical protein
MTNTYMIFDGFREVYNRITAFWDGKRTMYNLIGTQHCLGEICSFHLQDRKLLQP